MIGTAVQPRRPADHVHAVHVGQPEVEDHQVRRVRGGLLERLGAGGGDCSPRTAAPAG